MVSKIAAADGFIKVDYPKKLRAIIKTDVVADWYPDQPIRNRLIKLLRQSGMLRAGRQADTASRQIMIKPFPRKISHYVLSLKALGLKLRPRD